jgi:hypothetical protein
MNNKRQGEFKRVPSPVVGGFSRNIIDKICPDRTINLYPIFSNKAKNQAYLAPWPGLHLMGTVGTGVIRASTTVLSINFVVSGQAFYYLDSAFVPHALSGNIMTTFTGFVSSAANLHQVAFCDGVNAFYYNGTNVIPMTIPTGVVPSHVCAFDNYVIICDKLTNRFFVSPLNDVSTWDPLNFASVTSISTTLVAAIRLKRRVFIFGYQVGEVWVDAGASSFPLRRDNNLLIEHGIEAIGSIAQGFELAFYLSRDQDGVGGIMMIYGVQPIKISTLEIDLEIQSFAVTSDATGSVYKINGQIFYQINFTTANRTFVFNFDQYKIDPENAWHELMMLDQSRYMAENHSFYQEKHLMFSYVDNTFYELNENFFDNNGDPILRRRIYRLLSSPNYEEAKIHRYYLDMLQGMGDLSPPIIIDTEPVATQANDPQVYLSISEDGGITYKDYGGRSIGKIGDLTYRTFWLNMKQRRDNVAQITMITTVQVYILGASVDYTLEAQ